VGSPPSASDIATILAELAGERPDILLVGLGSPKQEQVIRALREHLPATWMIGVGVSFSFIAGDLKRAPARMRKAGRRVDSPHAAGSPAARQKVPVRGSAVCATLVSARVPVTHAPSQLAAQFPCRSADGVAHGSCSSQARA
jgi:hypothetical protein